VQTLSSKGLAELLVARYNGKSVAAAIITFYGDTASYLYGASSDECREVMAPYLLHWEAMKLAKQKGCKFYDLLAVEPFDNMQTANSYPQSAADGQRLAVGGKHKFSGITKFKEQFGGRKVHLVGGWDLVYKPTWYTLFKWAEKMRRH
jgi:lipid II:glycine glycyltransferase (peptidoglycan interpeptide bridge formation enzyme)